MYIKDRNVLYKTPKRHERRTEVRKQENQLETLTLLVEDYLEDVRPKGILDGTVVRSKVFRLGLMNHEGVTQAHCRNILRHLEPSLVC